MAEQTLECPKCKEADLNFEIETERDDDNIWYSAGLIADERQCDCEFSDAEITVLEGDASFVYAEGIHNYEP
ncbi:MAG TPA: hypothetical protein VIL74_20830 [Pyrinomonadaceae bacterium]|jgi:C4-type Zn-finger protein